MIQLKMKLGMVEVVCEVGGGLEVLLMAEIARRT